MEKLGILFLYVFILSILYIGNQMVKIITNILSEEPKYVVYKFWEKISNYLFISYFITYIIRNFI
jgi:hypothetical protein